MTTSHSSKKLRFTKRALDALPPQHPQAAATDAEYTDTEVPGLKVAVSKSGRKCFLFRYTFHGQKRSMKLGDYGPIDIQTARDLAQEARGQVQQDIDPQVARSKLRLVPSFKDFSLNTYLPIAETKKKSADDDKSKLTTHVLPSLGRMPINTIGTKDIHKYLTQLRNVQKLAPATANRHLSLLSTIFKCAIQHGHITTNPCQGIQMFKEDNMKERYLTAEELARLNQAMDDINPITGKYVEKNRAAVAAIKLLLLTGTRREEAMTADWEHVNLTAGTWYLPTTKNGRARHVTLNQDALDLFQSLHKGQKKGPVFVNPKTKKRLNTPVKTFNRLLEAANIPHLRIHDLRHTFASIAVNSGASLYHVQHLLGHATPKTTQRYAHLSSETLREVSNKVGSIVRGAAVSGD